jgi:hypothetical protein
MNNRYLAEMLANMPHDQVMDILAKSQELRSPSPDVSEFSKEVPAEKIAELTEKYQNLAAITQIRLPFTVDGNLTLHLELNNEYFHLSKLSLDIDDYEAGYEGGPSDRAIKLLREIFENCYISDFIDGQAEELMASYQEQASKLAEEIDELTDEYEDYDLGHKIRGEKPSKRARKRARKNPRRWLRG